MSALPASSRRCGRSGSTRSADRSALPLECEPPCQTCESAQSASACGAASPRMPTGRATGQRSLLSGTRPQPPANGCRSDSTQMRRSIPLSTSSSLADRMRSSSSRRTTCTFSTPSPGRARLRRLLREADGDRDGRRRRAARAGAGAIRSALRRPHYAAHALVRHMPFVRKTKRQIDRGTIGTPKADWCRHFVSTGGDFPSTTGTPSAATRHRSCSRRAPATSMCSTG